MNKTDRMRLHISLDDQISDIYNFTLNKLQQNDEQLDFELTQHPIEQLNFLKQTIEKLLKPKECEDCKVYQKQLQKLQADIRQHIKVQHQLKLYQDSLQEKASDNKREWTGVEKEIDGYKKKLEELKEIKNIQTQQINKLQYQNQQLKNQIKSWGLKKSKKDQIQLERNKDRTGQSVERRDIARRLEARTMMIDRAPLTKTINFNSMDERKSVDKARGITMTQDMSKSRQSLNNKSSHLLKSGMQRKRLQIVMRDKENEKRKINKVEYRR